MKLYDLNRSISNDRIDTHFINLIYVDYRKMTDTLVPIGG